MTLKPLGVDMQRFFRYTVDNRPTILSEDVMKLFEVLRVIWDLNRAGAETTTHTCSSLLGISRYRFRKIAHSAAEIDLVNWKTVPHRPNVDKRDYYLTDKGRVVLLAYEGKPLSFKEIF